MTDQVVARCKCVGIHRNGDMDVICQLRHLCLQCKIRQSILEHWHLKGFRTWNRTSDPRCKLVIGSGIGRQAMHQEHWPGHAASCQPPRNYGLARRGLHLLWQPGDHKGAVGHAGYQEQGGTQRTGANADASAAVCPNPDCTQLHPGRLGISHEWCVRGHKFWVQG